MARPDPFLGNEFHGPARLNRIDGLPGLCRPLIRVSVFEQRLQMRCLDGRTVQRTDRRTVRDCQMSFVVPVDRRTIRRTLGRTNRGLEGLSGGMNIAKALTLRLSSRFYCKMAA